jgi:threonine dehydratase
VNIHNKKIVPYPEVLAAQKVISGKVHRTPVVSSTYLGNITHTKLYFKLELFQKTGSFKPRGVLNKLHHLSSEDRKKGVVSISAGNHAQALAWVATQLDITSTIVMPAGSMLSKIEATRGYGGEVILTEDNLLETCLAVQKERDLILIHPFDDPKIIAGQGTIGIEILEDVPDVDVVIVGIGGGGLISGIAMALKEQKPELKVIGVEPEGASAMSQSLQRGEPVHLDRVDTIADGLAAPFAGQYTLAHVQVYVDDVVIVSDLEIVEAMKLILERCKVTAEPAAASTLAALLSSNVSITQGATVLCVLSGGNIDQKNLKSLL